MKRGCNARALGEIRGYDTIKRGIIVGLYCILKFNEVRFLKSARLEKPSAVGSPIRVMLYYPMLCYAILWCPMLCYAMLCYAMLRYAMLCCAMLCYSTLWYAILHCRYTISFYGSLQNILRSKFSIISLILRSISRPNLRSITIQLKIDFYWTFI